MGFFLFHHDPQRIPRPQLFKLTEVESWVGFNGSREGLLTSQRAERWVPKELRCLSVGPRWYDKSIPWDCTAPTSSMGDRDPLAPAFRPLDGSSLDRAGSHYHLEIDRARELQGVVQLFESIAQKLIDSAPANLVQSPKQRVGPAAYDPFELFIADVSSEVVLSRADKAKEAAVNFAGFVAWWTLSFGGWENYVDEQQRDVVRRCEFRRRPKRGCLLDLLFDFPYTNFEFWIDLGIPFYYQWTTALEHSARYARANPVMLEDYYHHANEAAGASPDFPQTFLDACKEEDYDLVSFDNYFQDKHERDDLVDTDFPAYSTSVTFKLQVFQGWLPITLSDRTLIEKLINSYECFPAGQVREDVVVIVRWAPRREYMGSIEDEEYTADDGLWDADARFPGRTYDKTTGWFTNDIQVLRELLRPLYAPAPGAFYSPRGIVVEEEFRSMEERQWYEQQLIDGVAEGDIRRSDFFRAKAREQETSSGASRPSLAERLSSPSSTIAEDTALDVEAFQTSTSEGRTSSRLSLQERLSSPTRPARRTVVGASLETPISSGLGGGGLTTSVSSGSATSSEDDSIGPRDPRFDPGQALRYADPHPIAADPRRIGTVYDRAYADYELYLRVCRSKIKRFANAVIGPPRPLLDNRLRPLIHWDPDVIANAILNLERPIDRIRVLLLPRLDTRLDSPMHVLNRCISGGYRLQFTFLRDPAPPCPPELRGVALSTNSAAKLSNSKTGRELYDEWAKAVQDLWKARTHAHVFLYEGGVYSYVIRHLVPDQGFADKAGRGVCLENRVATSRTMYLPDGLSRVAVYDAIGEEEKLLLNGFVKGSDGVDRWMLPPQSVFEVDGAHAIWEVGTGEWSLLEEDYLDDVMETWRTGSGRLRTRSSWEAHARQRARAMIKRDPSQARDVDAYPSQRDARAWASLLQFLYGSLPTQVRDVSGLARRDDLSAAVLFGE